ncbi:MAG: phage major capsid protein [Cyanobacteria bacterium P01_G01_bin.19]
MTQELLIRSEGEFFLVPDQNNQTRQIPKNNYRDLTLREDAIVSDDRTIEISVSSEAPYKRWWYYEILGHTKAEVDLSRMNDGAMSLYNHKRDDYVGIIEKAWLDGNKLYNKIRFGTHQRAEEIVKAINEKIFRNVSIGYRVDELVLFKKSDDDLNTYKATSWTPFESSFVTVPADATVGVGRQFYDLGGIEISGEVKEITPEWEKLIEEARADERRKCKSQSRKKLTEVVERVDGLISEDKTMSDGNTGVIDKDEVLRLERERTQCILAAGKKLGCPELAEKAIAENMDIRDARIMMYEAIGQKEQKPVAAGIKPVGMSNKERRRYSTIKAVGYAAGLVKADKVGLELEVSKALQERLGKAPKKIYLDQSELVSYRAPYETGVPAAAGNLIETELLSDRFIEQLFNLSAFLSMGVTYLRDLTGNIEIPRESTYTQGYWVGEKQTIPEEEGTFDKIGLAPHKLAVLTKITFEMLEQSSIDIERLFRSRLIRGLALEMDRTVGFGSGIGSEPLGIVSHPETKSIVLGPNGDALSYAAAVQMQTELADANALTDGSTGYVINARTRGKAQTTLDHDTGGGSWIYQPTSGNMGTMAGYQTRCSNQIPNNLAKGTASNLTAAFFGDFSNVLLALWSGMDVMANPYSEFSEAIIQVRAMQLADVNLTRGDYFCVATDIQNN